MNNTPSIIRESVRGAKLGAVWAGCIVIVIGVIGLVLAQFLPIPRRWDLRTLSGVVQTIGGFFGGVALAAVYGAITGALIIGGRAAIRSRRPGNGDGPR